MVGQIWPAGHSLRTPNVDKSAVTESTVFAFSEIGNGVRADGTNGLKSGTRELSGTMEMLCIITVLFSYMHGYI